MPGLLGGCGRLWLLLVSPGLALPLDIGTPSAAAETCAPPVAAVRKGMDLWGRVGMHIPSVFGGGALPRDPRKIPSLGAETRPVGDS